jgi:hypothetical protein
MDLDHMKFTADRGIITYNRFAGASTGKRKSPDDGNSASLCGIYYPALGSGHSAALSDFAVLQQLHNECSSNPDYPELKHILTLLVTWEQVQRYCLQARLTMTIGNTAGNVFFNNNNNNQCQVPFDATNADILVVRSKKRAHLISTSSSITVSEQQESKENNHYNQQTIQPTSNSHQCRQEITSLDLEYTLRYFFFHIGAGVYVKITQGRLAMFVPFANRDYQNLWHSMTIPALSTASTSLTSSTSSTSSSSSNKSHKTALGKDVSTWRFSQRTLHPLPVDHSVLSDEGWIQYQDMLLQLCNQATGAAVDCEFCINLCPIPVLPKATSGIVIDPFMQYFSTENYVTQSLQKCSSGGTNNATTTTTNNTIAVTATNNTVISTSTHRAVQPTNLNYSTADIATETQKSNWRQLARYKDIPSTSVRIVSINRDALLEKDAHYQDCLMPSFVDWELANPTLYYLTSQNQHQTILTRFKNAFSGCSYEKWCAQRQPTVYFRTVLHVSSKAGYVATQLSRQWSTNDRFNEHNPIDTYRYLDAAWYALSSNAGPVAEHFGTTASSIATKPAPTNETRTNNEVVIQQKLLRPVIRFGAFDLQSGADKIRLMQESQYDPTVKSIWLAWQDHLPAHRFCLFVPDLVDEQHLYYGLLMVSGCVIFRVAPPAQSVHGANWKSDKLMPFVDHIPVAADLSDLSQQIDWAKRNPLKCFQIACTAYELFHHCFDRQSILNHWANTLFR